jgi:hypothetical protein
VYQNRRGGDTVLPPCFLFLCYPPEAGSGVIAPNFTPFTPQALTVHFICIPIYKISFTYSFYFVFETWGTKEYNNPLNEKSSERKRGEKSTSVDAVMIGKKGNGKNILVIIEWKFTEDYTKSYGVEKCKYIEGYHNDIYDLLLNKENCPIYRIDNFKDLYYDPFYQLMRQTLWGWKMIEANECGCDEYIHLHIIPKENLKIQEITSPNLKLKGTNMSNVWKNSLKEPLRYKLLTPEILLSPLRNNQGHRDFFDYLSRRYLEKYI